MIRVAVFGGSTPPQPHYQQAYRLGALLAQHGYAVITGGYIGTMEAVSRGAYEAGGHVIGVPCDTIERWRPVKPNKWIHEYWRTRTLLERLNTMLTRAQAAIALPGGVGTLTEITLFWNLLLVGELPQRPLITVGKGWQHLLNTLTQTQNPYLNENILHLITPVATVDEAVAHLTAVLSPDNRS